ncbi:hypothetical protein P170DRAFT_205582 [Aspergillus steynii IBT 23096]|uniref:Uncharacterized protein n=1 Tax=Aspergillus steynii IBT 23096 TaxID=1392250 RepID=A0A2I2G5F2_9EURO|nr:uncharacterized protein P170DRAFT_205582 [Aspergillus steynii IBT 23096]PLB48094.1 hypothetical protein P170DRAFT_205582 [Aspergillus steynii IBT 23096]
MRVAPPPPLHLAWSTERFLESDRSQFLFFHFVFPSAVGCPLVIGLPATGTAVPICINSLTTPSVTLSLALLTIGNA